MSINIFKIARLALILSLLIATVSINLIAQNKFEGMIKYKISGDGEVNYIKYFVKGNAFRMEAEGASSGPGGAVIFKDNKMTILMPEQRMYMEFPTDIKINESDYSDSEEINLPFQTGETKNILGHECKKWAYSDRDGGVEIWAATDMGSYFAMNNPMQGNVPSWQKKLSGKGFFPLLVISKDEAGNETDRFEAVDLKTSGISDNLFVIPTGFNKLDMGNIRDQ